MAQLKVKVPDEYPIILLTVVILCAESIITGIQHGNKRATIFTKDFMKKFQHEHKAAFGMEEEVPENGHPDNCNGKYA